MKGTKHKIKNHKNDAKNEWKSVDSWFDMVGACFIMSDKFLIVNVNNCKCLDVWLKRDLNSRLPSQVVGMENELTRRSIPMDRWHLRMDLEGILALWRTRQSQSQHSLQKKGMPWVKVWLMDGLKDFYATSPWTIPAQAKAVLKFSGWFSLFFFRTYANVLKYPEKSWVFRECVFVHTHMTSNQNKKNMLVSISAHANTILKFSKHCYSTHTKTILKILYHSCSCINTYDHDSQVFTASMSSLSHTHKHDSQVFKTSMFAHPHTHKEVLKFSGQ